MLTLAITNRRDLSSIVALPMERMIYIYEKIYLESYESCCRTLNPILQTTLSFYNEHIIIPPTARALIVESPLKEIWERKDQLQQTGGAKEYLFGIVIHKVNDYFIEPGSSEKCTGSAPTCNRPPSRVPIFVLALQLPKLDNKAVTFHFLI